MTDKTLEALERIQALVKRRTGARGLDPDLIYGMDGGIDAGGADLRLSDLNTLLSVASAALAAPVYCGHGCACVTQCGDAYDHAGKPKPPAKEYHHNVNPVPPLDEPAQPPCTHCGRLNRDCEWPAPCPKERRDVSPQAQASAESEPKLDKPARVGNATFEIGVAARLVVEAAQRQHEYHTEEKARTPEQWREMERGRRAVWDMLNGSLDAAPLQQPQEGWVSVPREPTEAMHQAAVRTLVRCSGNDDFPPRVWRAMIAAAPSQGEGEG